MSERSMMIVENFPDHDGLVLTAPLWEDVRDAKSKAQLKLSHHAQQLEIAGWKIADEITWRMKEDNKGIIATLKATRED